MQVLPNLPGCPACSQPPKNWGKGNKAGEEPPVPEKPESTAPFKKAKDPHLALTHHSSQEALPASQAGLGVLLLSSLCTFTMKPLSDLSGHP